MITHRITGRPDILSAFKGCLVAHAAAAQEGTKTNPGHFEGGHWIWPPELHYTHFIVRAYIEAKGQLDLPAIHDSLELGLEIEGGSQPRKLKPAVFFFDKEMIFRDVSDQDRLGGRVGVLRKIRLRNAGGHWIGGPGLAAHASAIGLVNRNNIGRIFEDTYQIGQVSHENFEHALAGGAAAALTIAYAVTEGNQPAAIMSRLLTTLSSDSLPQPVPAALMRKLMLAERLLGKGLDTTQGIKQLRSKPRKTVIDVLPVAIYAALNGARSLGGLLGPLKIVGNYKSGMIAASIWGAMRGVEAIPDHYLSELAEGDCILRNAAELYRATVLQKRG